MDPSIVKQLNNFNQKVVNAVYNSSTEKVDKKLWQDCWLLTVSCNSYEEQVELLNMLVHFIETQVNKSYEKLSRIPTMETSLLESYTTEWKNFRVFIFAFFRLFQDFAKNVNRESEEKGILQMGFDMYKDKVIIPQLGRLTKTILHHINLERNNKQVFSIEFRLLIESFIEAGYGLEIGIAQDANQNIYYYRKADENNAKTSDFMSFYNNYFEKALLKEIEEIYSLKTIDWLSNSVPEYCKIALDYFEQEVNIAEQYYNKSIQFVRTNLMRIMIYDKYLTLCHNNVNGIYKLLEEKNIKGLASVYNLFKLTRTDALTLSEPLLELSNILGKYIQDAVQTFTLNPEFKEKPFELTNELINIRKYLMVVIRESLEFNAIIDSKARKEFDNVLNNRANTADLASIFAQYFDNMMHEDTKNNTPEAEVEVKMDDYLDVVSGLGDKDRYIGWYRNFLAPRILEKPSIDLENKFIGKMSQKWGQVNFHMLKTMINDINNSKEFDSACQNRNLISKENLEFSIKVLTQSSWPQNLFIEGTFHSSFKVYMDKIAAYYRELNAGRKILWSINRGDAEIRRTYASGKTYRFLTTTLQANVLLNFDADNTSIAFKDLRAKLGFDNNKIIWDELRPLIKLNILKREKPITKAEDERQAPDESEKVSVNLEFTSPKMNIVCIVRVTGRKKEEASSKVDEQVMKDREFQLDAGIVRIMKSRRELFINELQEEVKKIITLFTPDPKLVKKRLESLIERDYIIRNEDNVNSLIYKP